MIKSKYKEYPEIGKKYGKWIVISNDIKSGAIIRNTKERTSYWKVKCECGLESWKNSQHLKSGLSNSCKSCSKLLYYNDLPISYFNRIKDRATIQHLEFDITIEYVWELFLLQNKKCSLSGLEIKFSNYKLKKENFTASLDRINPKKGYIKGNVQWVHKHINFMKYTFDQNYFIKLCKLITDVNKN